MKNYHSSMIVGHVKAATVSLSIMFVLQAAMGLALAAARPEEVLALRHAAVASALLLPLALFARTRVRGEPAIAAGILAALLCTELALVLTMAGVPALPLPLQLTFIVLVYGGLSLLIVAAACAALSLRVASRPLELLAPPRKPRGRGLGRAA